MSSAFRERPRLVRSSTRSLSFRTHPALLFALSFVLSCALSFALSFARPLARPLTRPLVRPRSRSVDGEFDFVESTRRLADADPFFARKAADAEAEAAAAAAAARARAVRLHAIARDRPSRCCVRSWSAAWLG